MHLEDRSAPRLAPRRALLRGGGVGLGGDRRIEPADGVRPDVLHRTLPLSRAAWPLDDLKQRLARTRWPERETANDWSLGAPLAKLRALVDYWRTGTDWRRCEKILNRLPQYRTEIDGLGIHFLYVRSPHADALPIVITHGWPGSIIEFFKIIDPKANPTAHGGRAEDAFHVIEDTAAVGGLTSRHPAKKRTYRPARRVLIVWVFIRARNVDAANF